MKRSNKMIGSLKDRRELGATRKELKRVKKLCAWMERELKIKKYDTNHLYGLVEVMTLSVLRAKTIEELEEAKAEYREFRQKSEANFMKKVKSLG